MNIFFSAYIENGNIDRDGYYNFLVKELNELGHKVKTQIFHIDDENNDNPIQASELLSEINNCDIFIGEMTIPSQTLGFQMAYALQRNKPCLYLYNTKSKGKPKPPLYGNPSRLVTVQPYDNEDYKDILKKFLKRADSQLLTDRITFVSTKRINEFIDKKSELTGVSKGEIIRSILEDAIERTKKSDK